VFAPTVPLNVQFCAGANTDHDPLADTLAVKPPYPLTEIWPGATEAKLKIKTIEAQKKLQRPPKNKSDKEHPRFYDKSMQSILSAGAEKFSTKNDKNLAPGT
jgi:hypothetical protein